MKKPEGSIFKEYITEFKFIDKYSKDKEKENAVDVLVPVMHTNDLWENNLLSYYREIPIKNLLIGNCGCIDDSIEIVRRFPRVKVFNHKEYVSLGYSIKKLIEKVETEWFIYLHSDVYLPNAWFDSMRKYQKKYDWFECRQQVTVLADFQPDYTNQVRPLSGSQMGKKDIFRDVLGKIKDDFLYRNEDAIYAELLKENGYKYGRAEDVFHFHQVMNKKSIWLRKIKNVSFQIEKSRKEEVREHEMQLKAIIKYVQPNDYLIKQMQESLIILYVKSNFNLKKFRCWVLKNNHIWLPYIRQNYYYSAIKISYRFIHYLLTSNKLSFMRNKIIKLIKIIRILET